MERDEIGQSLGEPRIRQPPHSGKQNCKALRHVSLISFPEWQGRCVRTAKSASADGTRVECCGESAKRLCCTSVSFSNWLPSSMIEVTVEGVASYSHSRLRVPIPSTRPGNSLLLMNLDLLPSMTRVNCFPSKEIVPLLMLLSLRRQGQQSGSQ